MKFWDFVDNHSKPIKIISISAVLVFFIWGMGLWDYYRLTHTYIYIAIDGSDTKYYHFDDQCPCIFGNGQEILRLRLYDLNKLDREICPNCGKYKELERYNYFMTEKTNLGDSHE